VNKDSYSLWSGRNALINAVTLSAVMAGAETGVELADQLSELLGLQSNGTGHSEERRNKFAMGEAVRRAG